MILLDDSLFDRDFFIKELGKSASREELNEFIEQLKRSCSALKTERISFINDKYPEVIDAIQTLTQVRKETGIAECLLFVTQFVGTGKV